jgi:GntR family transcriptional repressor for pyruvate dehydrogenase complex
LSSLNRCREGREKATAGFAEDLIQKVKAAVQKGELKAGDRLPSHDELCERWGISRTTIREALNKLESMGILTKYQGRGTYINELGARDLIPANQLGSFLDKPAVLQLLEARELIEPLIAGLAAERRTEAELERLHELLDSMRQANSANDHEGYSRADHEFHLLISAMSRNQFLEVMMRNISEPLAVQQMEVIALKPGEQARISAESQRLHQGIFEAIREADAQVARHRMQQHLEKTKAFMKDNL